MTYRLIILSAVTAATAAKAADLLTSLRWKARPVVVFADSPDDPHLAGQLAALRAKARALADYDIKVVAPPAADAALRGKLGVPARGFAVVLVGKDGGVKETWREPVEPARIFSAIDAMPMRQDEVRRRG